MGLIDSLLEQNRIPDFLIRKKIASLCQQRLKELYSGTLEERQARVHNFIEDLCESPIAVNTDQANEQHYEVPAAFYKLALGKHLKYSCGYWHPGETQLEASELAMLELYCQRAQLKDGMRILELGCGWGSLTLHMAAQHPNASITGVSNSHSQRNFIMEQAKQRGLNNIQIKTCDMNDLKLNQTFDRIISIEMFEHMRNIPKLLEKLHGYLTPEGLLFIHIFVHKCQPYLFEVRDESDWMAKYFFTGGMMPSDQLYLYFQDHFALQKHWRVPGTHYAKTSEAWLKNTTDHKAEILKLFAPVYGQDQALKWWVYWRIFFMACAELWGSYDGEEWFVSHYLFQKRS